MASHYDIIKSDHANIISRLEKIAKLFEGIAQYEAPVPGVIDAAEHGAPRGERISRVLDQNSTVLYAWKSKDEALLLTNELLEVLQKHFDFEKAAIFSGICCAVNSEKIVGWVLGRIHEHGEILGAIEALLVIIELIETPMKHSSLNLLRDKFSKLHKKILSHSLEEDAKLSTFLAQNLDAAKFVKKLREQWVNKQIQ